MERFGFIMVVLLTCLSGCDASPDNSATGEPSVGIEPREPAQLIQEILEAEMTPEARMKALEPYIDVGRSKDKVDQLLGQWYGFWGHGPGFLYVDYGEWNKPGLSVHYYPDDEVCSITYRSKDGKTVNLRADDPITWPKTTDGKNAVLRQKNIH
jgi:hypothetical protein